MGSQAVLAPSEFRFLQPLERWVEKLHDSGDVENSDKEDSLLISPACGLHFQVSVAAGANLIKCGETFIDLIFRLLRP